MKRLTLLVLALVAAPLDAQAISRTEVLTNAKAYAMHPWTMKTANMTASCSAPYKSLFQPGDYLGLPYDWGGYMTLAEFDQQISSGYGAGSQPTDGVLACTAGVDCSGFVSGCWKSAHFTTSNIDTTSAAIAQAALLAGDVLNHAGFHVAMFSHLLASGEPTFYESAGYNVHENPFGGWSYVMGYVPRRYNSITGTTADDPLGTSTNPIPITSFPYADDRNTTNSSSSVFDRCALAPSTNEGGPEYVYQLKLTQPGQLTVSVTDDVGSDIDVHLYGSLNSNDCLARHDTNFTTPVDCGSYYVVADTFTSGAGKAMVGNYHLVVSFTPSGSACGAGPHVYATPGKPGDTCGYPGHESLGFCNPTLGADTCIYTTSGSGDSFCSRPCATVADCGAYAGGCCQDLGMGETYCMPASWCGGSGGTTTPKPPPTDVGADGGATDTDGGATGTDPADGGSDGASHGGCAIAGATTTPAIVIPLGLVVAAFLLLRRRRAFRA